MARRSGDISVFEYRDYRTFLRDWYADAKKRRTSFSFRTFSAHAGFTSPNFFKLVMDGDRNLTDESIEKFVLGLRLNKEESYFFRHLVLFTQAKNSKEKDRHYKSMLRSQKLRSLKPIEKDQYEYYSKWYHPVVRELVVSKGFDGTSAWLAHRISPSITPEQAKKSIKLLETLGLIEKDGDGKWKQKSPIVTTGPEVTSHILFQYHLNMLELAKNVLHGLPAHKRDVSALTLGVSKGKIPELKKMAAEFRQKVLQFVSTDSEASQDIVQLNMQLFPMTASEEEDAS